DVGKCETNGAMKDVIKLEHLSWGVKIKRKLKSAAPFLSRFRPLVGQCCHQCTPESLGLKLLRKTSPLGFQSLTCVNETHTGYRGWLVRRGCCLLFVWGCEVHPSPAGDRRHRVHGSERCGLLEHSLLALTQTFISTCLLRLVSWMLLKVFSLMFCSVQVNLNQLAALHRATQLKSPLVYVCVRQSGIDHALICLTLFCHNLRVPYTIYPAHVRQSWLRSILQRLGVVLLPEGSESERDAEMDSLYSPVMTPFTGELLREGASLSVGICASRGHGGQWLARVHQAISDGLVPDVSIVPAGVMSALRFAVSLLKGGHRGSVRIHFAQAFSLKEMCESGKCRVDGGRPLQELLLTAILQDRMDSIFSQKDVSWLLPPTIALTLHLLYSSTTTMAVMSTSLVSCLLLHKHRKGVRVSVLCRDICWLMEEVLFRNTDVGYSGSLVGLVLHALSLLHPYLLLAAAPPTGEPIIAPDSLLILSQHCDLLTHVFIHEAVGGGQSVDIMAVNGGRDYEVQKDTPVCDFMKKQGVLSWAVSDNPDQSSDSDCEEPDARSYKLSQPSHCPELLFFLCSLLSVRLRALCWALESLHYLPSPITYTHTQTLTSEKDCLSQLHAHLKNRAQLDKAHYESSSIDLVRMVLRTFIDLGVLIEDRQRGDVYLDVSPLFSQCAHKAKLLQVFKQFMYN
uniref:Glycerol-3-phosphate acyltransferase 2, mitochondrial n=1 Tax=Sinocyclocheilus anshuiensis TaxID=1608454 RepID=A0A671Q7U8_9TELE